MNTGNEVKAKIIYLTRILFLVSFDVPLKVSLRTIIKKMGMKDARVESIITIICIYTISFLLSEFIKSIVSIKNL